MKMKLATGVDLMRSLESQRCFASWQAYLERIYTPAERNNVGGVQSRLPAGLRQGSGC